MANKMTIYLDRKDGGYLLVNVDQEKVQDAGIIKYGNNYFVFDGQKSKVAKPIFVITEILEVK